MNRLRILICFRNLRSSSYGEHNRVLVFKQFVARDSSVENLEKIYFILFLHFDILLVIFSFYFLRNFSLIENGKLKDFGWIKFFRRSITKFIKRKSKFYY